MLSFDIMGFCFVINENLRIFFCLRQFYQRFRELQLLQWPAGGTAPLLELPPSAVLLPQFL